MPTKDFLTVVPKQKTAMARARISKLELKDRLYRRRYLVPNTVTVANLFCGFLTIIYASSGRIDKAVAAIAIAILLDGLDGRVARSLNATSKFGLEFDSFSDLVSFGVAPAILMYQWCFVVLADEFGVFVTFVYVICAASRLARFNITDNTTGGFTGLPAPAAGGMVAAFVYSMPRIPVDYTLVTCGAALMWLLSYLMISKIPYFSIKKLRMRSVHPVVRIGVGAMVAFIWYRPAIGLCVISSGYCASGPIMDFWNWYRSNRKEKLQGKDAA